MANHGKRYQVLADNCHCERAVQASQMAVYHPATEAISEEEGPTA